MKTTIKTLTRIRDHIRNVLLPTAQGKTEGKWGIYPFTDLGKQYFNIQSDECGIGSINTYPNPKNAAFIAATCDTAEPAWLDTAEEIDELLPMLSRKDLPWSVARYMKRRTASIIKNWKHTIK